MPPAPADPLAKGNVSKPRHNLRDDEMRNTSAALQERSRSETSTYAHATNAELARALSVAEKRRPN